MPDTGRFVEGQPLAADDLNRLRDELGRAGGVPAGEGGVGFATSGGTGYARVEPWAFWIKLTGGGTDGLYDWVEQVPDADGEWVDGPREGTVADDSPAEELNGNIGLTAGGRTPRAFARRHPGSRRLAFQLGLCS
jgi:hypothetical protein